MKNVYWDSRLGSASPELGAIEARNLVDVLLEIKEQRPDVRLKEFGRGNLPRGTWTLEDLLESVREDLRNMTPQERSRFDLYRYFWGYGPEGGVQIVHAPVRGEPFAQFRQEAAALSGPGASLGAAPGKRKFENLPLETQDALKRSVAMLTLLWGTTPGTRPERVRAYRELQKEIERQVERLRLDPQEVYFIFGDPGDPRTGEEARERAFDYLKWIGAPAMNGPVGLGVAAPKVGLWIKADGTQEEVIPEKGKKFTLQELQKMVGGYVERLQLPGRAVMIANEEGYPMGLPHNAKASEIAGRDIVGDVVVLPRGMGW